MNDIPYALFIVSKDNIEEKDFDTKEEMINYINSLKKLSYTK